MSSIADTFFADTFLLILLIADFFPKVGDNLGRWSWGLEPKAKIENSLLKNKFLLWRKKGFANDKFYVLPKFMSWQVGCWTRMSITFLSMNE